MLLLSVFCVPLPYGAMNAAVAFPASTHFFFHLLSEVVDIHILVMYLSMPYSRNNPRIC